MDANKHERNANKLWEAIEIQFAKTGTAGLYAEFSSAIHFHVREGEDPMPALSNLGAILQRLNSSTEITLTEKIQVLFYLAALPKSWDSFKTSILASSASSTFVPNEVLSLVKDEWNRRRMSNPTALQTRISGIRRFRGNPRWNNQRNRRDQGQQQNPPPSNKNNKYSRKRGSRGGQKHGKGKGKAFESMEVSQVAVTTPDVDLPMGSPEPYQTVDAFDFSDDETMAPIDYGKKRYVDLWQVSSSNSKFISNSSELQQNTSYDFARLGLKNSPSDSIVFLSPHVNNLYKNIKNHTLFACYKDSDEEIAAICAKHSNEDIWILDSGASAHTTGFMSDFHDVRKLPEAIGLITADNRSKVFITHVGTVLLKHTNEDNVTQITKLEPVYYQAHSSHRLLSQGTILRRGYYAYADENHTSLRLKSNDKVFMTCYPMSMSDNLHRLKSNIVKNGKDVLRGLVPKEFLIPKRKAMIAHNTVDYNVWHHHLGHPSKDVMSHAPKAIRDFPKMIFPKRTQVFVLDALKAKWCSATSLRTNSEPRKSLIWSTWT